MLKERNTIEKQLEVLIKRVSFKFRKDDRCESKDLLALARLTDSYTKLLSVQKEIQKDQATGGYEAIESGEACRIQDPSE